MGTPFSYLILIPMYDLLSLCPPRLPSPTVWLCCEDVWCSCLLSMLGGTWKVKSSFSWIDSGSKKCVGSGWDFLSWDTWKTSWRFDRCGGKATRYATDPTHFKIWKGLMKQGLSFLTLMALPTPVVGVIFKNMWSPSWNSKGFLLTSA